VSATVDRLTAALADRYRIERELGAGGMATVYLAHDVRHDRKVALKVLRPELSAILGADRFLAEIKTTANLQHPHILPLHDSGEAGGLVYYVMPFVEGESLRDRLKREHQLPVDEAVRIATEVADALQYAHQHGIVHRDIKPENILLHGGHAMVADFGIALAVSRSEGGTRMTETGTSLGTPHYMSPEQAMGEREITARADVYALGVVLYEMLTGEPPFTGATAQAIIARVMTEAPRSLMAQRHTIAPHVEAAVRMALEKLPADRFPSAAAFGAALANPAFATTAPAMTMTSPAARPRRHRWPVAVVAPSVVAVLALAVAAWALTRRQPEPPVRRYGLALPASQAPLPDRPFALAPDGSSLVYVGPGDGGTSQLWVKRRDRYEATPLAGTTGVIAFTVSPDGQWLAFIQNAQLKKLPLVGGSAITLGDSASPSGVAWLENGTIVYVGAGARQLRRVADVGGPVTAVWQSDSVLGRFLTPLPHGQGVLFSRCLGGICVADQDLWAVDLRSGDVRRVQAGATMGWYVPTGHVLYVRRDGGMLALPFDLGSLEPTGPPVPVLDSISVLQGIQPLVAVASDGTIIIRAGGRALSSAEYTMVWIDRAGREAPIDPAWSLRMTVQGGNVGWALSPDGRRLAIGLATDAGDDVWIKELPRGPLSRLTFDSVPDWRPRWAPGGRTLTYVSYRHAAGELHQRRADGTGDAELLLGPPLSIFEAAWSPDGRWLIARTGGTVGQVGGRDVVAFRPGIDSVPAPLVATPFDEAAIALSPDGRWLAYVSNETGRSEVYVRPFPAAAAGKWQVSIDGGVAPLWARNGRELFYVNGKREMVAATLVPGPSWQLGERRALFRLRDDLYLAGGENYTPYDVAADGRFLMARRVGTEALQAIPLIVAENWFSELRQKVGAR
jgi:serine/threonine-protein kinase